MTLVFILDGSFHSFLLPGIWEKFNEIGAERVGYYDVNVDQGDRMEKMGLNHESLPAMLAFDADGKIAYSALQIFTEFDLASLEREVSQIL